MATTPPGNDGPTQADKFRDLARQLECDEDEDRFEETVRRVAMGKGPPKDTTTPDSDA